MILLITQGLLLVPMGPTLTGFGAAAAFAVGFVTRF